MSAVVVRTDRLLIQDSTTWVRVFAVLNALHVLIILSEKRYCYVNEYTPATWTTGS